VNTVPTVSNFQRTNGIAGQFSVSVDVTYGSPDESHRAVFVGNDFGGPIVTLDEDGRQTFVSSAVRDRIGHSLNEQWVRRFYDADEPDTSGLDCEGMPGHHSDDRVNVYRGAGRLIVCGRHAQEL
jgi:hypothetical protein